MVSHRVVQQSTIAWVPWLAALVIVALLFVLVEFRTQDADSGLHVSLVTRLSNLPVARWIAPDWGGDWKLQGLYREHPVGVLLLPLVLARLGYPLAQAPFLANAIYQVLALITLQRVAAVLVEPIESRSLQWLLQLMPVAFVYRIRANHEDAVLMFFLAGLWGTERSRYDARWLVITGLAAAGTFLVKGVFVFPMLMACAVWLLVVPRSDGSRDWTRDWMPLVVAGMMMVSVAVFYELLYRRATGESFFAVYLTRQFGAAATASHGPYLLLNKLHNLASYTGRTLWLSLPFSLAAVAGAWMNRRRLLNREGSESRSLSALRFSTGVPALYVALFSFSDRVATRYVFPIYYLLGGCGAVLMLRRWERLRRLAERLDLYAPFAAPAVWVLLILLNLINGALGVPLTKF
jgi:hypothetical protein